MSISIRDENDSFIHTDTHVFTHCVSMCNTECKILPQLSCVCATRIIYLSYVNILIRVKYTRMFITQHALKRDARYSANILYVLLNV